MASARVRSITLKGKKFNVNKDLQNAGKAVTRVVATGIFDEVRKNLQVKRKRQGSLITQGSGSPVGQALRRGGGRLKQTIAKTRVFNALVNEGRLTRELGLTPGARRDKPAKMVNFVGDSLVARYSASQSAGNASKLQFNFEVLVPSMERITNNQFAFYTYDGRGPTTRGYQVEMRWLEWLLYEGGNIIIDGHAPREGEYSRSRQNTIMNSNPTGAKSWAVPLAYQGTEEDNFITRSYEKVLPSIREDIRRAIRGAISGV